MELLKEIQQILEVKLPDGSKVVNEGKQIGNSIKIGTTLFMEKYGVTSEIEYKMRMKQEGQIMTHAHIGLESWKDTADALGYIHKKLSAQGLRLDRFGLCLERSMGLPPELRDRIPKETGPRLNTLDDWLEVGRVAPIQPHAGDFMIGFPASVHNTKLALQAGVTTIGNLSQYFAHEIPYWGDDVKTTEETVKAIAIMASQRQNGALFHSYLDDGLGSLFNDYTSVAGWAILERYIVEELIGARLGHCFGGVTSNPKMRAAWVFVLDDINDGDCMGTMYYGNTIDFTMDLNENRGAIAEYLLWDIMAQLKCPTGHAVLPLPVTEGIRIPSAEEIYEAQVFGRRIEQAARNMVDSIDFTEIYRIKNQVVKGGRRFADNLLGGFKEAGVNIKDPVQMLYVLKKLGPVKLENAFGVGKENISYLTGREPVFCTDVFKRTNDLTEMIMRRLDDRTEKLALDKSTSVVLASTDVHEHPLFIFKQVLEHVGIQVYYLGAENSPEEIVEAAMAHHSSNAILISTHNGMALEFAQRLIQKLKEKDVKIPVFMGGKLNQGTEGQELPVDATEAIQQLGIQTCQDIEEVLNILSQKSS